MSGAMIAKTSLDKRGGASKARRRYASVMKPEYLAEIKRMRLMDDTFMSKCLENTPECIEFILRIIIGKKDRKVIKAQTEYPIKSLQGRGEARGKRETMLETRSGCLPTESSCYNITLCA